VPRTTRVPNTTRNPSVAEKKKPVDEMEGLFVDPEPQSSKKSKPARASDRRRERGQAPEAPAPKDTRTSMPNRDPPRGERPPPPPSVKSAMSEMKGFARATLTCTRGPEEGLSLNLIEGSYTVGRARENSFVLKDIAASRRHLKIDVDQRGARVIDLGSGNGSRVNGRRISEHELKHGDRIEIGGSVLLFQERGKPAVADSPAPVDDAQERVIRAAEKLAAELSERMRFGDEVPSTGYEDGHGAKTRAIPPSQKKELDEAVARAKAQQKAQPEKLWKETFTNLPLDRVVPAEEPLRGGGGPRAAEAMIPPSQPVQVAGRAPLPRPAPLPIPPPPDEGYDYSGSSSRGGSFMVSLLVTALVVVIGGGAVLSAFLYTRHKSSDQVADDDQAKAFDDAMAKYDKAADAGDWASALEYATLAHNARPDDKAAARAQREAKKHIDDLKAKPVVAPTPSAVPIPTTPANVNDQVPIPPPPAPAPPVERASAPPPPAPAPPPPKPKPKPAPVAAAPAPAPAPAATPASAPSTPAPKPKAKGSRNPMTDDQAQQRFEEAVDALRQKDNKKGCKILEEIADRAPPDSRWKEKADGLFTRRCGD
jgi:pSer/pThr/pTyr-binding forkhead associated (FHA) protein